MPCVVPKPCGNTGAWKTRSIGSSMSAFVKTIVAFARAMGHKIWRSYAIWPCIYCDEKWATNVVSKRDASGRGGIETISCRCYQGKPNALTLLRQALAKWVQNAYPLWYIL